MNLRTGVQVAAGLLLLAGCAARPEVNYASADARSVTDLPEVPVELLSARVDGDTLRCTVRYSGGCGVHAWMLRSTGPLLKSLPPKQQVELVHRADDACRALVTEDVALPLETWRAGPAGRTVLLLATWKEPLMYDHPE
jgi:hypothetical protein